MLPLAAVVLLGGGCRDGGTGAAPRLSAKAGPAFSASAHALEALGRGWKTDPAEPHACFASVAAKAGPIPYHYRRIPLHLPASAHAHDGAVAAFRYRGVRPDGAVVAVLNCVIPATERARGAVARRFDVPGGPEEGGVVVQGCVTDGMCELEGIVVKPPPAPKAPLKPSCMDNLGECDGDGDNGGESGGPDPCADCGPSAPTLSCTSGVQRGGTGSCTVTSGEVAQWEFTDGISTVIAAGGGLSWAGTAVRSGTVSASMQDGTPLQATLEVRDRGWTWATHAISEYVDGSGPRCLDHTPTYGRANGINLPADATLCGAPQRQIQPDSYAPEGDGFIAATVSGGPNHGMHYVREARLHLRRKSSYNAGLWANAAPVPLQGTQQTACGAWANWYSFTHCMGTNPEDYLAGVRAHEGYGTTGHNGHFSAAYDAVADQANDPMILFDQRTGANTLDLSTFIVRLRDEFYPRARRADDATLDVQYGGTVVRGNWSGIYHGWNAIQGAFVTGTHSI